MNRAEDSVARVEDAISMARDAAQRGEATEEVLHEIARGLGQESLTPMNFIFVLGRAFGIPLQTLRDIENWEGINGPPESAMTTAEVVSLIRYWIEGYGGKPERL